MFKLTVNVFSNVIYKMIDRNLRQIEATAVIKKKNYINIKFDGFKINI